MASRILPELLLGLFASLFRLLAHIFKGLLPLVVAHVAEVAEALERRPHILHRFLLQVSDLRFLVVGDGDFLLHVRAVQEHEPRALASSPG